MEKTLNIAIKETTDTLVKVINESGIPASVISLILKDLSTQINSIKERDLIADYEKLKATEQTETE